MRIEDLKREKLFVVLRNLVIAEVLVYLVFMVFALSADWGKIYEDKFLSRYIRFEILEFTLLGLLQLGLIVFIFVRSAGREDKIEDMIRVGEHNRLEFKATFRWDAKRNQVNKELEKSVMKTVAAFLNSEGGYLLIGVDDKGQPVGLETDLASLPKPDADGFENHFNNLFNGVIGPEFRRFVRIKFDNTGGKTVCLVNVEPSRKAVYLKTDDSESFYIRTGNATTPLKMSETATYVSSWRRER